MSEVSFDQVVRTRRTTRSYRGEAVPDEVLRELVEMAVLAPTGMNVQPWTFSVITSREAMRRANEITKQVCLAAQIPALEQFQAMFQNPEFDIFYGAPALIVIQGRGEVAALDCLLAAENLILAAHAKGLGSCFMGFVLIARENEQVRKALGVAEGYQIMAPIIVGYSDAIPQEPPDRRPPEINWIQ